MNTALLICTFLSQKSYVYQADLDRWAALDQKNPPGSGRILFIGSSTFTNWKTMESAFPGKGVFNRAYGGSGLGNLIRDYKVFTAYKPKQIVIYCGENDLAGGTTPAYAVFENFKKFFDLTRKELPGTDILYCAMKPSPARWHLRAKYTYGNHLIKDFLATQPRTGFVSCWDAMLNADGRPDESLFLGDMLHMNAKGYAIWTKILAPNLK
ncbi:MAG: GDSL-type esterase/lipase family protein [Armatimonadota bacterium]